MFRLLNPNMQIKHIGTFASVAKLRSSFLRAKVGFSSQDMQKKPCTILSDLKLLSDFPVYFSFI